MTLLRGLFLKGFFCIEAFLSCGQLYSLGAEERLDSALDWAVEENEQKARSRGRAKARTSAEASLLSSRVPGVRP